VTAPTAPVIPPRPWPDNPCTCHPDASPTLADKVLALAFPPDYEVVHGCPPGGSGLTPCCGRTPFELPPTDRITSDPTHISCKPKPAP
jgi:hypothetical protein